MISVILAASFIACGVLPDRRSNKKAESVAQDLVYEAVVQELVEGGWGEGKLTQLVFSDELLTIGGAANGPEECSAEVRKRMTWDYDALPYDTIVDKIYRFFHSGIYQGAAETETVEEFLKKSCSPGHLSRTFHTKLPRTFVASSRVQFDAWPAMKSRAPVFGQKYPGAGGVISFSRVGFDTRPDEAMVSVSFVCGQLCGSGWVYVLRIRSGQWQIAGKRLVWVS
ncbi:MAG TPA: hypothetical protein VJN93_18230 [Candidatus Acidoferrum sp.]|nr:hypothetical protein [Candidatus Acidoferrum sp.]